MDKIVDFLVQNSWLLILLGIWLVSALGNLATRAARKAAEQQQRQRRAQRPSSPAARPARPQPTGREAAPDPEEIAAQIRRMMGLEREAPPEPRMEPEPEPEPAPRPQRVRVEVVDTEAPRDRPAIADRQLESAVESEIGPGRLQTQLERTSVEQRRLISAIELREQRRRRALRAERARRTGRRRRMDLSDPAAAILLAEVLGPPRALRDLDV